MFLCCMLSFSKNRKIKGFGVNPFLFCPERKITITTRHSSVERLDGSPLYQAVKVTERMTRFIKN